MKTISKISLSLAIGVISLSGCKSKNETFGSESFDDKAYFESLRNDAYKSKTSTQTDIKALSDLLPEALNLTYDNISYSQTNGATTLSNVNLTVADSDFGVNIETLLLWDVNETAITERLSGENLNNDFRLLSRLEARNLSVFGLEAAFNSLMGASNDITQKILEDAINDDSDLSDAFPTQTFDNYEISLENFIVTDIKIHPWVLNLTQAPFTEGEVSTDANNIWHFYQKIAAWSYAFSYEDMAAYDGVFELEMTQDDIPLSLDMDIGLMAYKGYSRGDMEYGAVHDTKYVMDMATPINPDGVNRTVNTASSIEAYTYENLYLSQAMKHLAIGKMPELDNTDFMSLGIWKIKNSQFSIDNQALYSIDEMRLDMSEFHGLMPEIFDIKIENMKYNIAGFMSWMETFDEDLYQTAEQKAEMEENFTKVTEILNRHDMNEPSFDFGLTAHWDAEKGDFDLGYGFGVDDIAHASLRFDGILPDYEAITDILPKDIKDFDIAEQEKLFEETFAFKRVSHEMSDEGIDKLLALIIDFAKIMPDNQQAAFLGNATPLQLRQIMAGGVSLGGAAIAEEFPPALDYLNAIADFITDGGKLKIDLEARSPLTAQDIDNLSQDIAADPDKFEDSFKLNVVHETAE